MRCIGRTARIQRCRRAGRPAFCHQHRLQPWAAAVATLTTLGAIFGLSRDVVEPWQRPTAVASAAPAPESARADVTRNSRNPTPPPNTNASLITPALTEQTLNAPLSPSSGKTQDIGRKLDLAKAATGPDDTPSRCAANNSARVCRDAHVVSGRLLPGSAGVSVLEIVVENETEKVTSLLSIDIDGTRRGINASTDCPTYVVLPPQWQTLTLDWQGIVEPAAASGAWVTFDRQRLQAPARVVPALGGTSKLELSIPMQTDLPPHSRTRLMFEIVEKPLTALRPSEDGCEDQESVKLVERGEVWGTIVLASFDLRGRLTTAGNTSRDWFAIVKRYCSRRGTECGLVRNCSVSC